MVIMISCDSSTAIVRGCAMVQEVSEGVRDKLVTDGSDKVGSVKPLHFGWVSRGC